MGNMLKEGLEELKEKHPSIGDVRSIGLFACIELVEDRETKEPLSPLPGLPPSGDPMLAAKLSSEMRKRGMHCFAKWNYIFPVPPLCVGPSELQEGLAILDEVLVLADEIAAH
jgi:taurine--2-oxoglutarate transaminase